MAVALCLIKGLLQYVKALGNQHTFTLSVDIVNTGYCVSVSHTVSERACVNYSW